MLTACGCDCEDCQEYKDSCAGCAEIKGRVFWAPYVGGEVCPIFSCCDRKGFENCGECDALPCHIYFDTRDPSMTQEEHEEGVRGQVKRLRGM